MTDPYDRMLGFLDRTCGLTETKTRIETFDITFTIAVALKLAPIHRAAPADV
jgi:hypothetical protein